MPFEPIVRMWNRVDQGRQESDTTLFLDLLALGEMLVKVTVAGLVAALDDGNRDRYRHIYQLVRANGIGEWSQALDDILIGPASQHLLAPASEEKRQLTQRTGAGAWQYESVSALHRCVTYFRPEEEALGGKADMRRWMTLFALLRNKTKGHGAPRTATMSAACESLESSLHLISDNFTLFTRPWAYLHRSLSGKYRVTPMSDNVSPFQMLKTAEAIRQKITLADGIYVDFDCDRARVDLLDSDADLLDIFCANGAAGAKEV